VDIEADAMAGAMRDARQAVVRAEPDPLQMDYVRLNIEARAAA